MSEPISNPNEPNEPLRKPDGWELLCAGVLGTEFGRRRSLAVDRAIAQIDAEESLMETEHVSGWRLWLRNWWQDWSPARFAYASLLLCIIGLAGWYLWKTDPLGLVSSRGAVSVCTISGELDTRWGTFSAHPKVGDDLLPKTFRLESGVVELTFNSRARVAIEGPAQFTLINAGTMELRSGKLSADVPARAHGFTVKTASATVVDLGTRFGVDTSASDASTVAVFEGRVKVFENAVPAKTNAQWLLTRDMAMTVDSRGTATPVTSAESAYPKLSTTVVMHPANCGFDASDHIALGGMPVDFGYWSGPAYELTKPVMGVGTVEGSGMLRFLAPANGKDSEVWQLMNLRSHRSLISRRDVEIKSVAWFCRAPGTTTGGDKFGLTVAAYHGSPQNVEQLWTKRNELALAVAEKELVVEDNSGSWRKVEVTSELPSDADFLIVGIRAIAPDNATAASLFPGHFADRVDCYLLEPLRASSSDR
jgi:hypothetical protein